MDKKWNVEYDNDTGLDDGGFWEWWTVSDGEKSFKSSSQFDAEWLAEVLNSSGLLQVQLFYGVLEMDLEPKDLVGLRYLSGVDYSEQNVHKYGVDEIAQVIKFKLDDATYMAVEDPNDGYRSSMDKLILCDDDIKNRFTPVHVFGVYKNQDGYDAADVIQFYDVKTNKIVLEVGTNHSDDYYPSFVSAFYPENMIVNAKD